MQLVRGWMNCSSPSLGYSPEFHRYIHQLRFKDISPKLRLYSSRSFAFKGLHHGNSIAVSPAVLSNYSASRNSPETWKCDVTTTGLNSYLALKVHHDVPTLDLNSFLNWIHGFVEGKSNDKLFRQRQNVCEIQRKYKDKLQILTERVSSSKSAYVDSENYEILENTLMTLAKLEKTETGLKSFLESFEADDVPASGLDPEPSEIGNESTSSGVSEKMKAKELNARIKLKEAELGLSETRKQLKHLLLTSPERTAVEAAELNLARYEDCIGLKNERTVLKSVANERDKSILDSGRKFEDVCTDIFLQIVTSNHCQTSTDHLFVLSNVKLGMAIGEIDKMVVRKTDDSGEVEVLAILECKRNVNDIGRSFTIYQRILSWLTSETDQYDPATWRTKKYTKGHFDKPFLHEDKLGCFLIGPSSFRHFQRREVQNASYFLDRLYFATNVTMPGGTMTGLDSHALSSLAHRISSDMDFKPNFESRNVSYMEALQKNICRSLRSDTSSMDVLRLYAESGVTGRIILMRK